VRNVLARPKFDRYVSAQMRDEFLATYIREAEFVEVTQHIAVCRDSKDDLVLEAAVDGQATCIVSGDDDLVVLHPFQGIPILRAGEFLAHYDATAG
jgi:putative PIN family toxin of toxin-antitoxin system